MFADNFFNNNQSFQFKFNCCSFLMYLEFLNSYIILIDIVFLLSQFNLVLVIKKMYKSIGSVVTLKVHIFPNWFSAKRNFTKIWKIGNGNSENGNGKSENWESDKCEFKKIGFRVSANLGKWRIWENGNWAIEKYGKWILDNGIGENDFRETGG